MAGAASSSLNLQPPSLPPDLPSETLLRAARLTEGERAVFLIRRRFRLAMVEVSAITGRTLEVCLDRDRQAVRKLHAAGWRG